MSAYVEAVLRIRAQWCESAECDIDNIWFRGIRDTRLPLLPGAYWRKKCDETSLFLSFKAQVPSYVARAPVDDWDWYYLMQHHGLPTRLLDWSETPLTALYFGLATRYGEAQAFKSDERPGVWMLNPGVLNALTRKDRDEVVLVPDLPTLDPWLPHTCGRGKSPTRLPTESSFIDNSKPIAIYPKRGNPRLVAQRGVFTLHGIVESPLDSFVEGSPKPAIDVIHIAVEKAGEMLDQLRALGFDQAALFPEPDSVAQDLARAYRIS